MNDPATAATIRPMMIANVPRRTCKIPGWLLASYAGGGDGKV
jgi:hypothetical protein